MNLVNTTKTNITIETKTRMDSSTKKRFFHNFQSNPHWIDNLLLLIQAENGREASREWIFDVVQSVVNILLSAVAKYDAKFTFQHVCLSSLFITEKEKHHFELLIFISTSSLRPAEIRLQQDGCFPGLTLIEVIENTHTHGIWRNVCSKFTSGREYLSSKMLRTELSNLLFKLLADMLFLQHYHDKTTEGVEVRNVSSEDVVRIEINLRGLILSVDLLTAIDCEGLWPIHRKSSEGEKIAQKKSSQPKQKPVNCGIQLVSKASSQEYHWRIWFCKAERFELDFSRFPQRWKSFKLLKTFVYKQLGCDFLRPYILQTVLLHECAKFPDTDQWSEEKLADRVYGLIKILESFARDKFCPHFFIPSLNLFTEVSSKDLRLFCTKMKLIKER